MKQRSQVHDQEALSLQSTETRHSQRRDTGKGTSGERRRRQLHVSRKWRDTGLAALYMAPVLILFFLFSYYPFFRAIWLSLHITNELGEPVKFVGFQYYARILKPDQENDYLRSLVTSCEFALIVVSLQILCGLGLGWLAMANVRGIRIFRSIFTLSI